MHTEHSRAIAFLKMLALFMGTPGKKFKHHLLLSGVDLHLAVKLINIQQTVALIASTAVPRKLS